MSKAIGKSKRLLLVRGDNIGDAVLFSGTLKHYRYLYRHYEITLALRDHVLPLFRDCPYIDKLVRYDDLLHPNLFRGRNEKDLPKLVRRAVRCGNRMLNVLNHFLTTVLPRKYDVLICPVRSVTPDLLRVVENARARSAIGIAGCTQNYSEYDIEMAGKFFDRYMLIGNGQFWQHELDTNLQFLNFLGARLSNVNEIWPELWIETKQSSPVVDPIRQTGPFVCVAPFSSPRAREVELPTIISLIPRELHNVVLLGVEDDVSRAQHLERLLSLEGFAVVNATGKTTLQDAAAIIRGASLLVSVDTSLLHIGISLGVRTLGVVGGGHWGRFHPWGTPERNIIVNSRMECYNCNWRCKYQDYRCVNTIDKSAERHSEILKLQIAAAGPSTEKPDIEAPRHG